MIPSNTILDALIQKGVSVPHASSVVVGEDVDPTRIAAGTVLHPGTRLGGAGLSIGPGCEIGGETPATVLDCQLDADVSLKGGFFQGSVFWRGSSAGSGAHVRPGCILEEEASIAHTVGLKQTILFPFVTLGSLINFCDVLMAGGTSRKDHSEVGSSFIHFNFTPHGDKATASLLGDTARGVLLREPPVFLGGQGGLVGPVQITYGTVLAAGSICRRDLDQPDHLYRSGEVAEQYRPYRTGRIREPDRKLSLNLRYLGNLWALKCWYRRVRRPLCGTSPHGKACVDGGLRVLDAALAERCKRLDAWLALACGEGAWDESVRSGLLAELERLMAETESPEHGGVFSFAESENDLAYVETIQALPDDRADACKAFLDQETNRFVQSAERMTQET